MDAYLIQAMHGLVYPDIILTPDSMAPLAISSEPVITVVFPVFPVLQDIELVRIDYSF
jgi:hypothetical protein